MAEQREPQPTVALHAPFEYLATKADLAELRGDNRTEMAEFRGDLRADHASLRGEMTTDNAKLRGELKEEISKLRSELKEEISNLRSELKEEIGSLRSELKDDIAALDTKVGELETSIEGIEKQFSSLKWFIGILVTGASIVTSILVSVLARFIV